MGLGPEKRVENALRKEIENCHGWVTKTFASPNTNKGIPDLLAVLHGRFIALEVKRLSGGKPTPVQLKELLKLNSAHAIGVVTNDVSLVTKLDGYLAADPDIDLKTLARDPSLAIDLEFLDSSAELKPTLAAKLWHNPAFPKTHSLAVVFDNQSSAK